MRPAAPFQDTRGDERNHPTLVLTRRENESITIGDGITVTVLRIYGDRVKIGLTAPRELAVMRDDAKRREPRDEVRP